MKQEDSIGCYTHPASHVQQHGCLRYVSDPNLLGFPWDLASGGKRRKSLQDSFPISKQRVVSINKADSWTLIVSQD